MTDRQRREIAKLRQAGYGYSTIADAVGLSKDSVKSYCRLHDLAGVRSNSGKQEKTVCRNCGKAVLPMQGKKQKQFCTDACRMLWWNDHREQVNHKGQKTIICAQCGHTFGSYKKQQYCSRTCYANARRKEATVDGR